MEDVEPTVDQQDILLFYLVYSILVYNLFTILFALLNPNLMFLFILLCVSFLNAFLIFSVKHFDFSYC